MQNTNKEAQIQDLSEAVHQRDMRLRHQDADIIEKTRQTGQLTIDDRHLTKLKAHQEARKQLKARISLRDENQKQKDKISLLNSQVLTAQESERQARIGLANESTQHKDTISSLRSQLHNAEESARQAQDILRDEIQQQKDKIASLNGHLKLTIGSAHQDRISLREEIQKLEDKTCNLQGQLNTAIQSANRDCSKLREEIQQRKDKISGLQRQLDIANGSAIEARKRQNTASDQRQEAVTALEQLKKDSAERERNLEHRRTIAEAKVVDMKVVCWKGCFLARDVRFWHENRQAERFAQAGKYEQDAVRAAKNFKCADATCTICSRGG